MKVSNLSGLQLIYGFRGLSIKYRHTRRLLYKTCFKQKLDKLSESSLNNFSFDVELANSSTSYRECVKLNCISLLQQICDAIKTDNIKDIVSITVAGYASAHRQHKIVVTRGAMAFKKRGKESYILKDDHLILNVTLQHLGSADCEQLLQLKNACISTFVGKLDTDLHANKIYFSEGIHVLLRDIIRDK